MFCHSAKKKRKKKRKCFVCVLILRPTRLKQGAPNLYMRHTNLLTANLPLCFECQHGFFRNLHSIRRCLSPKRTRTKEQQNTMQLISCHHMHSTFVTIVSLCVCVCANHGQLFTHGVIDSDLVTIACTRQQGAKVKGFPLIYQKLKS